mgnify:CR=1 FL=1
MRIPLVKEYADGYHVDHEPSKLRNDSNGFVISFDQTEENHCKSKTESTTNYKIIS